MQARVQFSTITENHAGQRIDNYLFTKLKGVPKTHIYKLIRSGQIRINKKRCKAETKLQIDDIVRIPPVRTSHADKLAAKKAPARQFDVLFEDTHLLIIHKPAGIAVHGGSGVSYGVIESLRQAKPECTYLELAHRLDKETSGILVVAKKRSALTHVQQQFKQRNTFKLYLAGVHGDWLAQHRTKKIVIDTPLHKYQIVSADGKNQERRVKATTANDPSGKHAVSIAHGILTAHYPDTHTPISLVKVSIKTGRTHQIRVHLLSKGHPIIGDTKYNRLPPTDTHPHMLLHAHQLHLDHPATGERLEIECAPPAAFEKLFPSPAHSA